MHRRGDPPRPVAIRSPRACRAVRPRPLLARVGPAFITTAFTLAALFLLAPPAGAAAQCEVVLDVDADGEIGALTDGLLVLRYLFGFTGAPLINAAVDTSDCTRCTAPEIVAFLDGVIFAADVDQDGELQPLTDGLLILRALFGFTGNALVSGAVDLVDCERCDPAAIGVHIGRLAALAEEPLDVWEPTTVPFDTDCPNGCQEVEQTDLLPHLGVDVTYHHDPLVDDAIAQWGDCLGSMLECIAPGGEVGACAAAAACPAECKALFDARAPDGADQPTLLEVLNGVYVNCGAPCRPLEEVEP